MRSAIILTHNRPELLRDCVAAIAPQVDVLVIIDNASDPPVHAQDVPALAGVRRGAVLGVPDQPPNLAALWNVGIRLIHGAYGGVRTAFLCDDVQVPPGWFDAVTLGMVEIGATAGCSNPWGTEHPPILKNVPDHDITHRMVGWAFILDLASDVRPDERFHWWWCDTDVDWQARAAGGMVMIGGYPVANRRPNDFTATVPGLGERAGQDGQAFAVKWGRCPW